MWQQWGRAPSVLWSATYALGAFPTSAAPAANRSRPLQETAGQRAPTWRTVRCAAEQQAPVPARDGLRAWTAGFGARFRPWVQRQHLCKFPAVGRHTLRHQGREFAMQRFSRQAGPGAMAACGPLLVWKKRL